MHNVTLANAASTAALTVGLAAYAALIFAGIAVTIFDAPRRRRGRATAAAVMVGVLTLGGLAIAIASIPCHIPPDPLLHIARNMTKSNMAGYR